MGIVSGIKSPPLARTPPPPTGIYVDRCIIPSAFVSFALWSPSSDLKVPIFHFETAAIWTSLQFSQYVTQNRNMLSWWKKPLLLIFSSLTILSVRRCVYAHICQLTQVKRKSFFIEKVSSRCFCWFQAAIFICVPKLYTNVVSPYKALQWCVKCFRK